MSTRFESHEDSKKYDFLKDLQKIFTNQRDSLRLLIPADPDCRVWPPLEAKCVFFLFFPPCLLFRSVVIQIFRPFSDTPVMAYKGSTWT